VSAEKCDGCDGPGYHRPTCPFWQSLPPLLARLGDVLPAMPSDATPADVAAWAMMHPDPRLVDRSVELERVVPAVVKGGKVQIDVRAHELATINRVTPEMLIAIVANIIATSPTAAEACVRLRVEVSGWKWQDETP
jgi:hypothetical protein